MMRFPAALIVVALLPACAANPPAPRQSQSATQPAAAVVAPAATVASNSPQAPVAGTKTVRKDGTEVFCRREPVANTRLGGQKVCLTREEWDQRADLASEAWRETQRSAMPEVGD
jgi:hypothetical protein